MSRPRIVVVGSSNIDMVVKTDKIPHGGETVLGGDFVMVPGGKGANQAVCAAKLGADVKLVARVGKDIFGEKSIENFKNTGVCTEYLTIDNDTPSGVALICVDKDGENAIVVAPGANYKLNPDDVEHARDAIAAADIVILQFEIPPETVEYTIKLAHSLGTKIVLNPAPIRPIDKKLYEQVDILVPNQHEAAALISNPYNGKNIDPAIAAKYLIDNGIGAVVVTLGSKGAYAVEAGGIGTYINPMKVVAVDTTAAGDAFTASLAYAIAEGKGLKEASEFASKVAAITVTKMGAQPSMPARDEVDSYTFGN